MSDPTSEETERRPLGAAALAVLLPGLGHAYIRAWVRALLWLTLFLASLWFLGVADLVTGSLSTGAVADLYSDSSDLALFTVAIWAMNVIDAYLTTSRMNQRARQGEHCPHCGKELDGDLEFCHWCTTPLDAPETEADEG